MNKPFLALIQHRFVLSGLWAGLLHPPGSAEHVAELAALFEECAAHAGIDVDAADALAAAKALEPHGAALERAFETLHELETA